VPIPFALPYPNSFTMSNVALVSSETPEQTYPKQCNNPEDYYLDMK